jgi:hypothetical protein
MYKHGIIPCSIINMLFLFMVIAHILNYKPILGRFYVELDCCFVAENFNSRQYAFFGKDSPEGIDLGYLDDGNGDGDGRGFSGHKEELHLLSALMKKRFRFRNRHH